MEGESLILSILTAMITPAVLILACGSLSLTTSQRLSRSIDRTRKIASELNEIETGSKNVDREEQKMLYRQMENSANRAILLQRAMTLLYASLSFFIATSLLIGIFELLEWDEPWSVAISSFIGVVVLFSASITLIMEARLSHVSINQEMHHVIKVSRRSRMERKSQ